MGTRVLINGIWYKPEYDPKSVSAWASLAMNARPHTAKTTCKRRIMVASAYKCRSRSKHHAAACLSRQLHRITFLDKRDWGAQAFVLLLPTQRPDFTEGRRPRRARKG